MFYCSALGAGLGALEVLGHSLVEVWIRANTRATLYQVFLFAMCFMDYFAGLHIAFIAFLIEAMYFAGLCTS